MKVGLLAFVVALETLGFGGALYITPNSSLIIGLSSFLGMALPSSAASVWSFVYAFIPSVFFTVLGILTFKGTFEK